MPLIIDGHNLIPKIPGLSLQAIDDETQLVEMLGEYCRRSRRQVEVFFDNAPPGVPRARAFGRLTARFVRAGVPADQAIREKLVRLGKAARNWTVVSSDHQVQAAARAVRATVLSAEAFAQELHKTLEASPLKPDAPEDKLSPEELESWLKLFGVEEKDD
jgi:predicted RNA-binding protein with PIN domain